MHGNLKLKNDAAYMERVLALARRGSGFVHPNPMIGAVVVQNGEVVGSGWHRRAGLAHAEVEALKVAGEKAKGATLYINMEPCNHFGKTPPCTHAIVEAGISRVVIGMRDPNPHVKGGGIEYLEQAGVVVDTGVLEARSQELNLPWSHWVQTGSPFVLLKLATSLDGKISSSARRWISSPASRLQVQRLRRHFGAVMVGAGTVLADNPALTNRTGSGAQPLRVIIDTTLSVPPTAQVYESLALDQQGPSPIAICVTTTKGSFARRRALENAGVEVVVLEDELGRVDLNETIRFLGKRGIQSVLCEGGARIATTLLTERICQRVMIYQAPIVIGDIGLSMFDQSWAGGEESPELSLLWSKSVGVDSLSLYTL